MNLHSIQLLVTSSKLSWMKWSLGGICSSKLRLGGIDKPFSSMIFTLFQACVKMKQTLSQAHFSYVSSLCKNETTFKHDFSFVSSLCKNETSHSEAQFSYVSSLCKNETTLKHNFSYVSSLYKNETYLEFISVIIFKTR